MSCQKYTCKMYYPIRFKIGRTKNIIKIGNNQNLMVEMSECKLEIEFLTFPCLEVEKRSSQLFG